MQMPAPRFSEDLAAVVFGEDVEQFRAPQEEKVLVRFRDWIAGADRGRFFSCCGEIDARLVPVLSGPNMLELARLIEARFPEAIEGMPRLSGHLECLTRAHHLAQVFMPGNLRLLVAALAEEGAR